MKAKPTMTGAKRLLWGIVVMVVIFGAVVLTLIVVLAKMQGMH